MLSDNLLTLLRAWWRRGRETVRGGHVHCPSGHVVGWTGDPGLPFGDRPRASNDIEVQSTHGAGDVFAGVFCASIASKEELLKALEIANKKAAFHVAK